jgi:hypothetical protein
MEPTHHPARLACHVRHFTAFFGWKNISIQHQLLEETAKNSNLTMP